MEKVSEVAVIGIPDEKWGEVPIAFVTVKETIAEEAIISHCKNNLGGYKVPKKIIFVDTLPKNSTGKIQKNKLLDVIGG